LLDRIYLNEDLCYELENRHKKLYDWYLDIDDDLLDLENRYNALQIDLVNQKKENAVMKKVGFVFLELIFLLDFGSDRKEDSRFVDAVERFFLSLLMWFKSTGAAFLCLN
jgi:hypothetical protein